jgi:hypothetical protein
MTLRSPNRSSPARAIFWFAAVLSSAVIFFTAENIWIDPRLRNRFPSIPSLRPEAQSGTWFLVAALGALFLALVVACLVFLLRDKTAALWSKAGIVAALGLALLLGTEWALVTNGRPGLRHLLVAKRGPAVVLNWHASASPVLGYNVYRRTSPNGPPTKLNTSPIVALTYTDTAVQRGVTYYYVARAVDARGVESEDSNPSSVTVP